MVDFKSIFFQLEDLGVYDYVLPFLLVFTILFAVLEKTKILGTEGGTSTEPRRNLNTILALIISLIVVVRTDITQLMNDYLSKMALFIIVVLIFMLTTGIFGANVHTGYSGIIFFVAMIISILAVFWALSPGIGLGLPQWLAPTEQDRAWILLIAIMILVVWFITRKPKKDTPGDSSIKKIIEGFGGKP